MELDRPRSPVELALASLPREALADLQRRHGLPITGRLDRSTERAWHRERAWGTRVVEGFDAPTV
ncbi:MAG: peptidoglycan-binding protein [Sandaracinus sp.]|nr:peptidoglycan-binding protein [Sandaracinus sp.]MCB9614244.1 peptidoglycan-binding protein [Sandaracinus sp.]MCB9625144.1 peptidoglycan-binding protein [Sandaracinus sp.]